MGVDDMIFNPCGCIFGETEPDPVPIPGARFDRQMSQRQSARSVSRSASTRTRGSQRSRSAVGRQPSNEMPQPAPEETNSVVQPIAALLGISALAG